MTEEGDNNKVAEKPKIVLIGASMPSGTVVQSFFRDEVIVQVSCGSNHSAVVCESGRVYEFLKYDATPPRGISIIYTLVGLSRPMLVEDLEGIKIVQAACGDKFTVLLSDAGQLYSLGCNQHGQLGLGHVKKSWSPTLVTGLPSVKKVDANLYHTMALAVNGTVWVCGYNESGELGLGHTRRKSSFTKVHYLKEIVIDIACGAHNMAILTATQILMISGSNGTGQLGLGQGLGIGSFQEVLTEVASVFCGYSHFYVIKVDGSVWNWGYNTRGQLGRGDKVNSFTKAQVTGIEDNTIATIFAGCNYTALMKKNGDVLVCGGSTEDHEGNEKHVLVPTPLNSKFITTEYAVKQIAFTQTYTLIVIIPKLSIAGTPKLQQRVPVPGVKVKSCLTDWENSIMHLLECPICLKIMCAPIHQCANGHNLCGTCRYHVDTTVCPLCQGEFITTNNIALQSLSAEIQLPCNECMQRMLACDLEEHIKVCPKQNYSCPMQQPCGWSGQSETMLTHAANSHPGKIWRDLPHLFVHSMSDELVQTNFLVAHGQLFVLYRRYKKTEKEFEAFVRYIGPTKNKDYYKYELAFIVDGINLTYSKTVTANVDKNEEIFQSSHCIRIKGEYVDTFLQQGHLVCRAAILKAEASVCSEQIKALLSASVK